MKAIAVLRATEGRPNFIEYPGPSGDRNSRRDMSKEPDPRPWLFVRRKNR